MPLYNHVPYWVFWDASQFDRNIKDSYGALELDHVMHKAK